MVLIGKSGDAQSVCLHALGNRRPIHVHRNISMPNLFERRIENSVLCTYLNVCLIFGVHPAVITYDNVPALQFRRDIIDPVQRGLIESLMISGRLGLLFLSAI